MRNQEITFDTATGINMTGWWSNPSTGESYQVVDQFFQDNTLYVKTAQGQIINFNRIQNFVRSDQPITRPQEYIEQPKKQQNSKLLEGMEVEQPEPLDGILEEDLELIRGNHSQIPVATVPDKSVNSVILEKMFSKAPEPVVSISLDWNWSKLETTLDTLVATMELSKEEIVEFLFQKYCSGILDDAKQKLEEIIF